MKYILDDCPKLFSLFQEVFGGPNLNATFYSELSVQLEGCGLIIFVLNIFLS